MKVAILGASGGMGTYFARYFEKGGATVRGSDVSTSGRPARAAARSNRKAVKGADLVIVAVPLAATVPVVKSVSPSLSPGTVVVEITSVKQDLPRIRRILEPKRVRLLSVHPLFGPSSKSPRPSMVVVGGRTDLALAKKLFPDARLTVMSLQEHDAAAAYLLSLVHLVNLAWASATKRGFGLRRFEDLSTPTGQAQQTVAMSVLSQDPALYSHIEIDNPHALRALRRFRAEVLRIERMLADKDYRAFSRLFESLSGEFEKEELAAALRRAYSVARP